MIKIRLFVISVIASVGAALAGPVMATVVAVPDAGGTFNTNISENVSTFPASRSYDCGTASITGAPLPTLSVTGTNCNNLIQAIFTYWFMITGPADGLVPISVASTYSLSASGNAQAGESLTVAGVTLSNTPCADFDANTRMGCGSHSATYDMSLLANRLYGVTMMVVESNVIGSGSGSAFLDPQFSFGANFVSDGYQFVFSQGIGNGDIATNVPEPSSLALLGLGLAGVAALRRKCGA